MSGSCGPVWRKGNKSGLARLLRLRPSFLLLQPPSAVAVSGPGSVHPDDDFGSFASHRSTADDDEDDFGNFNAAPSAAGGAGPSGSGGAGPSGSGGAFGGGAAGGVGPSGSGGAGPSGSGSGAGAGSSWAGGFAGAAANATAAAGAAGVAGSSSASGLSSAGPSGGAAGASAAATSSSVPASEQASAEVSLLSLPAGELKAAVVRALQPLLLGGLAGDALVPQPPSAQQLAVAWAQLHGGQTARDTDPCRDGDDADAADVGDAAAAMSGIPMPPLPAAAGEGGKLRSYVPQVRWGLGRGARCAVSWPPYIAMGGRGQGCNLSLHTYARRDAATHASFFAIRHGS